jgi:hypothetical protein
MDNPQNKETMKMNLKPHEISSWESAINILLLCVMGITLFLMAGCSNSQLVNVNNSASLGELITALHGVTAEDLDAATTRALAATPPDIIGAMCYPVLKKYLAEGAPGSEKVAGAFDSFEKIRLQAGQINQDPIPTDLRIGCAPLVQSTRDMIIKISAIIAAGSQGIPIP